MSNTDHDAAGKPPTANTLGAKERAELVKKARKLQEVLGVPMHVVDATTISSPPAAPSSSTASEPPQAPPRKRARSLKKRKEEDAKKIMIAMSTAVHVQRSSTPIIALNALARSEAPAFTPTPPQSPAPFTTSRASMKPLPRPLRAKRSPVAAETSTDSLVQPVIKLTPLSITDSPYSQTRRPSSIASISTFNSSNLFVQFPGVSSDMLSEKRRLSLPPSPKSTSVDSFPNFLPTPALSAEALRQRHINMANKLHRHLGELIPPGLLLNQGSSPCSPSTPMPSPVEAPNQPASASNSPAKKTHKHSRSLWAGLTSRKPSSSIFNQTNVPSPSTPSHSSPKTPSPVFIAQPVQPPRTAALERAHQYANYHQRSTSDATERNQSSDALLCAQDPPMAQQPDWTTTLNTLSMPSAEERMRKNKEIMEMRDAAIMSAKEKSLRVRRAAKMAQKFGEAPPHVLFHQITNTALSFSVDALQPSSSAKSTGIMPRSPRAEFSPYPHLHHRPGHSRASSLSVSTAPSVRSSENDVSGQRIHKKARSGSIVGIASVAGRSRQSSSSSVARADELEREREQRNGDMKAAGLFDPPAEDGTLPSSLMSTPPRDPSRIALPATPESPVASDASCSSTSTANDAKDTTSPTYSPKTPASLAALFVPPPPAPLPNPISADKPIAALRPKRSQSQSFTSRRRQATKLTQFFGVDYPDLYQAMVIGNPTTIMNNRAPPSQQQQPSPARERSMERKESPVKPLRTTSLSREESSTQHKASPAVKAPIRTTFEIVSNDPVVPLALRRQSVSGAVVLKSGTWGRPRDPEEMKAVMNKLRELKT